MNVYTKLIYLVIDFCKHFVCNEKVRNFDYAVDIKI